MSQQQDTRLSVRNYLATLEGVETQFALIRFALGALSKNAIKGFLAVENAANEVDNASGGADFGGARSSVLDKPDDSNSSGGADFFYERLQGGKYNDVKGIGGEGHHMPSHDSYKGIVDLSRGAGAAIAMEPRDHALTASYGNTRAAQQYRARQRELIRAGRFHEAMQMDIDNVRGLFGDRYNEAIDQMLKYFETVSEDKITPK